MSPSDQTGGIPAVLFPNISSTFFCPSCHEKKVLLFGEFITGTIAFPVPHRQYVFSLPIMLRVYFRNNRQLLKCLGPALK